MQDELSGSGAPDERDAATVDGDGAPEGALPPDGAAARRIAAGPPSTILQRTDPDSPPLLWGQAFPAATWRKILGARTILVTVEGGPASLLGAHDGHVRRLGPLVDGRRELSLAEHDEDWFWVEGEASEVTWTLSEPLELPPVTVVVPTYRREADALAQVRRFLAMDAVTTVVVVDQGGTLAEHRTFAQLQAAEPGLRLVTQPNLGGSGGYARGMLEADPSTAVLFSDDDAVLSEESLRRMLTYQALAVVPTIVGTPLFSAQHPTELIAHSEKVDARAFQWRPADRMHGTIELAGTTPEEWTFLAAHEEANYTGWWGTLFPPGTADDLGLPVPLFLKWDDAEYGLRATARGYVHVVLPGTAVHHPPWSAYRTQMTWTARILHRNRLAIAAAYGAGRGVIASSLLHQTKHVLAGHLLTAELWENGIDAVRSGPESWLGDDLEGARARTDGAEIVDHWHEQNDIDTDLRPTHASPLPLPTALRRALLRVLLPDAPPRMVLEVPADEVHWRTTLGGDGLLVTDADGQVEVAFAVHGSAMRRALSRTVRSHLDLARRWPELQASYHRALPEHTTRSSWAALFAGAEDATGRFDPRGAARSRRAADPRGADSSRPDDSRPDDSHGRS
ncbi:glycosyltransferase [Brachybacterium ginsengisoli]|uniref:glycosyltransferase n=1 Tax=Brachybacterium ginsengisoli TaxID=1331682 RepID=UPI00125EF639|nr:glycosyltransferase [Brachybacterium ginsengisoli]